MAALELDIAVMGVEQTVAQLDRVDKAAAQAHSAQTRRFTQTVEQIREEAEWSETIERAKSRLVNATRTSTAATTRATQATTAAANASRLNAGEVQKMGQRLTGAVASVAALANALGATGAGGSASRAVGLVGSIAGATTQAVQMGATFGPGGAVVGAIMGAIPVVTELVEIFRDAEDGQENFGAATRNATSEIVAQSEAFTTYLARFREVREAQQTAARRHRGELTAEEQDAELERQNAIITGARETVRSGRAEDQYAARRAIQRAEAAIAEIENARLAAVEAAGQRSREETEAASAAASQRAVQEAERREHDETMRVMRELEQQERERAQRAAEARRRREQWARDLSASATTQSTTFGSNASVFTPASGEAVNLEGDREVAQRERAEEARRLAIEQAHALAEAQREVEAAAMEASQTFHDSWTTSLDDVRAAWETANSASLRSGRRMISESQLLERTLVAVGNNITETLGDKMKGAFEDALGAWLDGSKSFVESAEEMAKGVIKALTIESVVQALTEAARGFSAIARQDYVAAPQHFIAAAAWGAVGVAAGTVGAAVGAFGGGGDKSAPTSDSRSMGAGVVQERERTENVTINVYPGMFTTRDEVANGIVDGLNYAARTGARIDPRLMRSAGR